MTEPLSQIGRVKRAHGLKGELKVEIEEVYLEDFLKATVLYLGSDRQQIPYFLESRRSLPQPIIKLEEVDSREEAEQLSQPYIFIPTAQLTYEPASYTEDNFAFGHLIGLAVQNLEEELLGKIDRIEVYPHQEMGVLIYKGKEVLIPLNESYIVSVDEKAGLAVLDLPEGLLAL